MKLCFCAEQLSSVKELKNLALFIALWKKIILESSQITLSHGKHSEFKDNI